MKPARTPSAPKSGETAATNQENAAGSPNVRDRPLHQDIASRAQELWHGYGRPSGRDEAIWLEAERQLLGTDAQVSALGGSASKSGLRQTELSPEVAGTPGGRETRVNSREEPGAGAGGGTGPAAKTSRRRAA